MSDARHPYAGRRAVLATMHRKEEAIAPAMFSTLGLIVAPTAELDTDELGTFSGEIPRDGTMLEVAVRKARLGMSAAGVPLGLASEGSFGPHPAIPFFPAGMELLVFVDDERGIVVHESLIAESTNFDHLVVSPDDPLEAFLARIGFPEHGLIVRPNGLGPIAPATKGSIAQVLRHIPLLGAGLALRAREKASVALHKGVVDAERLSAAIADAAAASSDGRARLETDMRAHLNPTRMKSLTELADRLAQRLATLCPCCGAPGFGRTDARCGLLCEACRAPTEMVAAEVFACPRCDYSEERPRFDGLQRAPAQYCAECNP